MIQRFVQLQIGLMLCSLGLALVIKADLGADPWTVFHVGVASVSGLSVGTIIQLTGALFMLLAWAFLRAPVGIGSVCNMALVGPWINAFLSILPSSDLSVIVIGQFLLALLSLGFGTALYISADMGAGPRDSFTLGMVRCYGVSIKYARFGMEVLALIAGFLLNGPLGIGTVIFALAMGPLMQFFLQRVRAFSLRATKKSND